MLSSPVYNAIKGGTAIWQTVDPSPPLPPLDTTIRWPADALPWCRAAIHIDCLDKYERIESTSDFFSWCNIITRCGIGGLGSKFGCRTAAGGAVLWNTRLRNHLRSAAVFGSRGGGLGNGGIGLGMTCNTWPNMASSERTTISVGLPSASAGVMVR